MTALRPKRRPADAAAVLPVLRRRLRAWYRRWRRDLPWRRTMDPYAILVSEVMLQQTTVRVVEPYFRRFLARFPNAASLARSSEEDVLSAWSGLGYYRRARDLRRSAQEIVRDHGGSVPSEEEAMLRLPGVGRYTAGAVLSIAYDRPFPVLDGNVARVLARIFAVGRTMRGALPSARLWEIAARLVPPRGAGEHNQALMELGALVCLPAGPRCSECPVADLCAAALSGQADRYPGVPRRREPRSLRQASALVLRGPRVLFERRDVAAGLLGGMWELPTVTLAGSEPAAAALAAAMEERGLTGIRTGEQVATIKHSITNRRIELAVFAAAASRTPTSRAPRFGWFDPRATVALTGIARKSLRATGHLEG